MVNTQLTSQFAERLREAMIAAGFNSSRSSSGVNIQKLTEITGYSEQICRKYLRGESMPELTKLVDIAAGLNVSPGWLAFGDSLNAPNESQKNPALSMDTLRYLFARFPCTSSSELKHEKSSEFLIELLHTLSLIHGTEEQSRRIIDLALASQKYSHSRNATR